MSEVHRFSVVKMLSEAGNKISYDPHGPEIVMAKDYDALAAEAQALREQVARSEQHRNDQADLIVSLRTEVAALRARVAVVPDASTVYAALDARERLFTSPENIQVALEAQSRLNGLTVSEGLLRRLCEPLLSHADYVVARNELRALFNEDKENGNG
ncbi:TPA: hypothetical protein SL386_001651 [Pseudomonas aeruginosa]|nr:hypothetical protein [Pseudomonas aeruginosa]HEJ6312620.1 hypothetical protein [Pseudomonas aeruginosa]